MDERLDLEQAIAALEAQRATLGDAVADASIAALREKLAATVRQRAPDPRTDSQRKTVTVVLADVQGSTDLAERLSVEAWVEVMEHLFQLLQAEVYRYGGEVNQFRGDGILAFFGFAHAHEDDPERAILAALAMQQVTQLYAAEFSERTGLDLRLRVGVNTGEVIVTQVGDRHRHSEETAMGRAIALAARMESSAAPGTVLVAEDTYKLVRAQFEWDTLGELAVRGIQHPIKTYRPLRHCPQPGQQRGLPGLVAPLIGRERELLHLQETVQALLAGTGRTVMLVGEAGLGKSRLVAELRQWVDRQVLRQSAPAALERGTSDADSASPPLVWLEGRCVSYASSSGHWLWADMVRNFFGLPMETPTATVANDLGHRIRARYPMCSETTQRGLASLVLQQLDWRRPEPAGHAGQNRADHQRTGSDRRTASDRPVEPWDAEKVEDEDHSALVQIIPEAVVDFIEMLSGQSPVLIVCEDLHWADATSLQLLSDLFPLTTRLPVTIIGVLRPVESPVCERVLAQAAGYRYDAISLAPLSAMQSAALVGRLLRADALPDALKTRVLEIGEGNPFYLEEILRALMDEGAMVYDPVVSGWRASRDVAEIAIPDTLQAILQARIDRLPAATRAVLQLAAVAGRIFQYALLEALVADPENLDRHLEILEEGTLIREHRRTAERGSVPWLTPMQARTFIFKHHLTQQAAYQSLLERERGRLHREVAEAIKRLFAHSLWGHADMLAYHWERTDEPSRAIPHLLRAGDSAGYRGANEEAEQYLRRALLLARSANLKLGEAEALTGLGTVARHQGSFEAARAHLQAAVDIYAMFGNQRRVAWLLIELALIARRRGAYAEAEQHLERVLDISRLVRNPRDEVHAMIHLARLSRYRGDAVRARDGAASVLDLSRMLEYTFGETLSQMELGAALRDLGAYEAARTHLGAALQRYEEREDQMGLAETLIEFSWLHLGLRELVAARNTAARAVQAAQALHSRWRTGEAQVALGAALSNLGHLAEAEAAYRDALRLRLALREDHLTVEPLAGLARLALMQGDVEAAAPTVNQVLERLKDNPALEGTRQPFGIYLTCYDVLAAAGDVRAAGLLTEAGMLLRSRVEPIAGPQDRRRFLERIPEHRRLCGLVEDDDHRSN